MPISLDPPEQQWRITPPDPAGEPILARFEAEPPAAHVPGETVTFEFAVLPALEEERGGYRDRHARLLGYERVAGAYASGLDVDRRPWFREQHDTSLSAVVSITPPDWLAAKGVRGLWGLVESVLDMTNTSLTAYRASVSVLFLAEREEFATEIALRNAMEADGI